MAKRSPRSTSSNRPQNPPTSETFEGQAASMSDQATDMGNRDTRAVSMGSEPSEEDIRVQAYRRYLERGGGNGRDFDDWLEAERELRRPR